MDSVMGESGIATTSTVLDDVRLLGDNKQVLRAFDRLEKAGLLVTLEDPELEWDSHLPQPRAVKATESAWQLDDEIRVRPEAVEEEMDEEQLRELAKDVRKELEQQRKVNEQMRKRLGELERFIEELAEEVEDVSEVAEEANDRSMANRDRFRDPERFGFEF